VAQIVPVEVLNTSALVPSGRADLFDGLTLEGKHLNRMFASLLPDCLQCRVVERHGDRLPGLPLGFDGDGDVTLRGYSRYPGFDRSSFRSSPGHARLLPNPRVTWLAAARMPPRMGSGIRINSCPPL
jgi:hypothetical protein